jgi:hypothetical protein
VDEDAQRAKKRAKPGTAAQHGDGAGPDGTATPNPVITTPGSH